VTRFEEIVFTPAGMTEVLPALFRYLSALLGSLEMTKA